MSLVLAKCRLVVEANVTRTTKENFVVTPANRNHTYLNLQDYLKSLYVSTEYQKLG